MPPTSHDYGERVGYTLSHMHNMCCRVNEQPSSRKQVLGFQATTLNLSPKHRKSKKGLCIFTHVKTSRSLTKHTNKARYSQIIYYCSTTLTRFTNKNLTKTQSRKVKIQRVSRSLSDKRVQKKKIQVTTCDPQRETRQFSKPKAMGP